MCHRRSAYGHSAQRLRRAGAARRNPARSRSNPILGEQPLADDRLLDLAGSLADEQERSIAHQPLDLILFGVAVSTVDAEALLGDLRAEFAGKILRHSRRDVVALTGILQPGRVDHHQMSGLDFGCHFRDLEGNGLVLGDRLAEGVTLLGVACGELERADGHPDRPGRYVDASNLDAVHHLIETLPRYAAHAV